MRNITTNNRVVAYLKLARPDNWFKNIFMLPGMLAAYIATDFVSRMALAHILIGVFSACLIASANYVINEWIDADYDRFHPVKKNRPSVLKQVTPTWVAVEYFLLLGLGFLCGAAVSKSFLTVLALFALAGLAYNLKPLRTKDLPILDVLSESLNNPIRFLLGWYTLLDTVFPPSSILISYWMGGAYLMNVKRYAELRFIDAEHENLKQYRKSFRFYTVDRLMQLNLFYAMCSVFFLGIFLIKYRIETLISFPFISILFCWYLKIGMKPNSPARYPETMYKEASFFVYVVCVAALLTVLLSCRIPWLDWFLYDFRQGS